MLGGESGRATGKEQPAKYDKSRQGATPALASAPKAYNADADVAMTDASADKKVRLVVWGYVVCGGVGKCIIH